MLCRNLLLTTHSLYVKYNQLIKFLLSVNIRKLIVIFTTSVKDTCFQFLFKLLKEYLKQLHIQESLRMYLVGFLQSIVKILIYKYLQKQNTFEHFDKKEYNKRLNIEFSVFYVDSTLLTYIFIVSYSHCFYFSFARLLMLAKSQQETCPQPT